MRNWKRVEISSGGLRIGLVCDTSGAGFDIFLGIGCHARPKVQSSQGFAGFCFEQSDSRCHDVGIVVIREWVCRWGYIDDRYPCTVYQTISHRVARILFQVFQDRTEKPVVGVCVLDSLDHCRMDIPGGESIQFLLNVGAGVGIARKRVSAGIGDAGI